MWRKTLFVVILLIIVVILLAKLPARWLSAPLMQHLPMVQFSSVQGSVWSGQLDGVNVDVADSVLSLGRVQWSLRPLSLFELAPVVDIEVLAPEHQFKASVRVNTGGELIVSDAGGHFPVRLLEPWFPLWVSGNLRFQINDFSYANHRITKLTAILAAFDVEWLLGNREMPLGSYMAEVNLQYDDVVIEVYDQQAALGVEGGAVISAGGDYQIHIVLIPRDRLVPEITRSIKWLGKPDANGNIAIDTRGSLY